jgi:hypothetical protein
LNQVKNHHRATYVHNKTFFGTKSKHFSCEAALSLSTKHSKFTLLMARLRTLGYCQMEQFAGVAMTWVAAQIIVIKGCPLFLRLKS